jgi:hypothetical protein
MPYLVITHQENASIWFPFMIATIVVIIGGMFKTLMPNATSEILL